MKNGFCIATGYDLRRLSTIVRSYPGVITIINESGQPLRTIRSKAPLVVETNEPASMRLLSCLKNSR